MKHLIPAYGRDYTSAKAVEASWRAGHDFLLCDPSSPWNGRPVNKDGVRPNEAVSIRYAKQRRVTVVRPE